MNTLKNRFTKLSPLHWDALIYPHTVSPFGGYSDSQFQHEENPILGIADMLARLWSVFGEPSEHFEGEFDYYLFDNLLGISVCIDTNGRYWMQICHHKKAPEIENALSQVLAETIYSDCELIIFGSWKIGAKNGTIFVQHVDSKIV